MACSLGYNSPGLPTTKPKRPSTANTANSPSAQKLDDKADRLRLYGWSTAVLAAGCFGVALTSFKTTHRVFPGLSFRDGEPHVGVSYAYSF